MNISERNIVARAMANLMGGHLLAVFQNLPAPHRQRKRYCNVGPPTTVVRCISRGSDAG